VSPYIVSAITARKAEELLAAYAEALSGTDSATFAAANANWDKAAEHAARCAQKPDNGARLSRNPRKNFFLSVSYLTLLNRFLNDAA
jgi:hypothetical protein